MAAAGLNLPERLSPILLWVDDDGPIRFRYEEVRLQRDGWSVHWANSTEDGAVILASHEVDGLITDLHHPLDSDSRATVWGGFHLLKWLRDKSSGDWGDRKIPEALARISPLAANREIPILIATAFADEEVSKRIGELPRSEELSWLLKPLDDKRLEAFVATLNLNRRNPRRADSERTLIVSLEELEPAWDEVRRYLTRNPNFLHQMDPRHFERLVAEIFRNFGWEVDLTSRTRDGGYDIVAVKREWPNQLRLLIEAKRLSPDRKVGVGVVRGLYGVKSSVAASQAILATSSYVSRDARKEFARVIPWELDFLERDKILAWCAKADPSLLQETESGGSNRA